MAEQKNQVVINTIANYKNQIKENNTKIDSYVNNIEDFKSQIRLKENDISRYKAICEKTYDQLTKTKLEYEKVVNNYSRVLKERTSLAESVNHGDAYNKNLSTKKNKIVKSIHTLEQEIKKDKNYLIEVQGKIAKLQDRLDKVQVAKNNILRENKELEGTFKSLQRRLPQLDHQYQILVSEIDDAKVDNHNLNLKCDVIRKEINLLKESFMNQETRAKVVNSQKKSMQQELAKLQETKELLLDEIEIKTSSVDADASHSKNISKEVKKIKNDISKLKPTDILKQDNKNIYVERYQLATAINLKIHNSENASILFSAAIELVDIISDNEFEDLKWFAQVSTNKTHDGCKIRFKNLKTQYTEMKKILKPITQKFAEKFKAYGFKIETRSKTSPGEVLEAIEFRMSLEKLKRTHLEAS